MKTLKKTLCLVLVVAMMMSVCVFSASAFKDDEEITYTEAVDLLSGLGIINGFPEDDTFRPDETLTRAQAAKIITFMLDAEDYAIASDALYTDVPTTYWAAGYIAFCTSTGIVAGNGDGTFDPEGKLTGYAWAKMLLCALGYNAEAEEMTGTNWRIGTARLAKSIGLFNGNLSKDKAEPCTREEAALYAYNLLTGEKALIAEYEGGTSVSIGDITFTSGGSLNITDNQFGEYYFGLTQVAKEDVYGRTYLAWTNGQEGKKEVVYSTITIDPVLTSTTVITKDTLVKELGKNATLDGEALANIGANGTVTEIYATDVATDFVSIQIETYVWTLAKTDLVKANAKTETKAGILLGDDNLKWDTEEAYKEGDVVLYTLGADGKVASAELAPYITGAITATSTSYVRVNGEKMYLSANNDGLAYGKGELAYVDGKTEVIIYTDNYGYIIDTDTIDNAPVAVDTDYVYVIEYQAKAGKDSSSDLFGETAGVAAAAKAKVLDLETGKVEVVDLAITTNKSGEYVYANTDGSASTQVVKTESGKLGAVWSYAEQADGSYALEAPADTETVTVIKNSANVGLTASATSKTVLKVVEYSVDKSGNITGAEITTTTGIANFPKDGETYTAVVTTDRTGAIVTELLVVQEKVVAPVVTPATYAVYLGAGEATDVQYYAFYVVENGETKVVNYAAAKGYEFTATVGDVVTIELTDGKLTDVTVAEAKASGEISFLDETFVIVNGSVYYFADSYTVVNSVSNYDVDTVAVGSYVDLYVNAKGQVEFVVIGEAPAEE